jgi:hypothetical protein
MELTIENATLKDGIYSWDVPLTNYKIEITVVSSTKIFQAKYNDSVIQYLESGRTDTCPAIFSGNFNVFFFTNIPSFIDIQDIRITLKL